MIAYFESSALALLALKQPGHDELRVRWLSHEEHVCHVIGIVELRSAAARWMRRAQATSAQAREVTDSIQHLWRLTTKHPLDDAQIQRAAGLCENYQLRAYDALHLAAAEALMRIVGSQNLRWFGFDQQQNQVAKAIGLRLG